MRNWLTSIPFVLAVASPALAQSPAARVGDPTTHGGSVTGPGVASVLIGGRPAAVLGDATTCPVVEGTPPNEVAHLGGPIVTASATVIIGGRPAARAGDANAERGSSARIATGAASVLIGP